MTTARRSLLALDFAARLQAQDVAEDDGGLIRYAERLARRTQQGRPIFPMAHLAPLAERYEQVERAIRREGPPVLECHHAAVQHGKTTLIQAFILRTLRRNPTAKIGYASYGAEHAIQKMAEVRELAPSQGIHLSQAAGFAKSEQWRTEEGGMVVAGGVVGGQWTGKGLDAIVVDDPYKNDDDAYSTAYRVRTEGAFERSIRTRVAPWTSIVLNHARWHPNDLIGVYTRKGWAYICLPAIGPGNALLWPERWTLAELLDVRDGRLLEDGTRAQDGVSKATWNALYQGRPQADGAHIFDPAHLLTYDRLPVGAYPYREAMGVDLAYGARARHDRSALVAFRHYQHLPRQLFLVDAWAGHEAVELFACRVAASQVERGGGARLSLPRSADEIERTWRPQLLTVKGARRVACRWYTSTTEAGTAGLMSGYGASVTAIRAAVDKLARAQAGGYTAAWSEGRILVPARGGEHVDSWRIAHEDFTGADGDADDPIDASVAAHDEMGLPAPQSLGSGGVRAGGQWGYGGAREC
jgi:hypothetical protein